MKKIFVFLLLMGVFLYPVTVNGENKDKDYYKVGDVIPVAYVCRDLDKMLKIAELDIQDSSKVKSLMRLMFKTNICVMFPKIINSKIKTIVLSYRDSEKRKSYLLELESQLNIPVYIWYMDPEVKSKVKV